MAAKKKTPRTKAQRRNKIQSTTKDGVTRVTGKGPRRSAAEKRADAARQAKAGGTLTRAEQLARAAAASRRS